MQSKWVKPPKSVRDWLWKPGREPDPEMEVVRRKTLAGILASPKYWGHENRHHVRLMIRTAIPYRETYKKNEGRLLAEVKDEIASRAKKQAAVRFLDLGPGYGEGLRNAEKVAPNVYASGLGLGYPEENSHIPKGAWIRSPFESAVVKIKGSEEGYYDVIQSNYGLRHAINTAVAFENALNSLRYDGKLFNYQPKNVTFNEWKKYRRLLKRQGFTLTGKITYDGKEMEIITRNPGGKADFRKYYAQSVPINKVPMAPQPPIPSTLERIRSFFKGLGLKKKE